MDLARRCMKSARIHNAPEVAVFPAITPKDLPTEIMVSEKLAIRKFIGNPYSRFENVVSCFLSHYLLWKSCIELGEPILILEHDAVFTKEIPWSSIRFEKIVNFGKPSFGKFKIPSGNFTSGGRIQQLFSKRYFPGCHGYGITPEGAREIIEYAKKNGPEPADVFLDSSRFNWLQEYYPWPIEVVETFSTVQIEAGAKAKHAYNRGTYRCMSVE